MIANPLTASLLVAIREQLLKWIKILAPEVAAVLATELIKKFFFPNDCEAKLAQLMAEHERMIASLREQEAILKDLSASPAAHSTARKKLMRYSQEIKKLDAEIEQLREILHSPVSDQDSEVKRAEQEKEQELLDETTKVIQAEQKKIDAMLADVQRIGRNIMAEYLRTYELEKKLRDQSKNPGIWSGDSPLTDAGPVQLIHEAPAKGVPEVAQQLVAQTGLIEAAQKGLLEYEKAGKTAAQVVRDAIQEGMQQAENAIVRFATTGKLEFNSFAQSVIADLIRIQVRQNIIGPLGQYAVSFLSGLFNAGGYNFNSAGTMWGNKPVHPNLGAPNSGAPYLIKHRGGVVGAETSVAHRMVRDVAFDYARRPVYGGLASNEVPAILQRGEMVIPRNLVQASQQPPQVEIHFENRGTPQREVGRTVQFDGQRAIVSVILDDMDRNGPIAQTMQRNFALNPAVS